MSSAIRRLNVVLAWGMAPLAAMGLIGLGVSDLVPSRATIRAAEILSVVCGVVYGAFALGIGGLGWNPREPEAIRAARQSPLLGRPFFRGPFMGLACAGLAWLAFCWGLPWALNATIGVEGTETLVIDGWSRGSFRFLSCARRPTVREVPDLALSPRALCVSLGTDRADFPVGASLVVRGRRSVLGINARSLRVIRPTPEP